MSERMGRLSAHASRGVAGAEGARCRPHTLTALALLVAMAGVLLPLSRTAAAPNVPGTAEHPPTAPPAALAPPASSTEDGALPALTDLSGWLDYRQRRHISSLPLEARLFYRRGIIAHESGNLDEAARLVRGAADLDPTYVTPHLTLASWSLLRDPSQSLLRYATVLELARQNFLLQLALCANAIYAVLQALFLGILATAALIVFVHQAELRHPWREQLRRILTSSSAEAWSWALMIMPFFLGLGPALPVAGFLALLWPMLRARERFVFMLLVASLAIMPLLLGALDRLTLPLDSARGPLYGVAMVESEPASAARAVELQNLSAREPQNGFLAFSAGWMTRRSGDVAGAERLYRRALQLWPDDDRLLNNLANVLMVQGHGDQAFELYRRATSRNPNNPAAWFNLSQLYTQRFDFRAATDALSRASALNFEMVKTYQGQSTDDGYLALVDQWIAPERFWESLLGPIPMGAARGALPPGWRDRVETRGWEFTAALIAIVLLGIWSSVFQFRTLPLRSCSTCGRIVCRRCAARRRELALCPACAAVEKTADSPDFARVLLAQRHKKVERRQHLLRTALAALVPGLGLIEFRRSFSPLFLLTIAMGMLGSQWVAAPPFAFEPRLALTASELPWVLQLVAWSVIYSWSLIGYFRLVNRADQQTSELAAPTRSRSVQASSHTANSAAA